MRHSAIGILFVSALALTGCGQKSDSAPQAEAPTAATTTATSAAAPTASAAPAAKPIEVPASAAPDQVVTVFLNALRTGDSPTTESLLTAKAREELAKHSLSVDVQSAPNANYQVRPGQGVAGDPSGAHVSSVWTEKFQDGEETYEIVWALRRQQEGWRVAGMMMQLLPGQDMQFLNFEDPEDMLRKKDAALAALQPPAAETAQQPITAPQQPSVER